jgi:heavy metal translocating P-type ATPase
MVGTGVGARLGILFKGGEPLELAGRTTRVLFDKTGTLTKGTPQVDAAETVLLPSAHCPTPKDFWRLLASAEQASEHLLARTIVTYAKQAGLVDPASLPKAVDFKSVAGLGVRATVQGKVVVAGNKAWLAQQDIDIVPIQADLKAAQKQGKMAVCVAVEGAVVGLVLITDALKPEAYYTIAKLTEMGLEVYMVTGDNRHAANFIGEQLGLPPSRIVSQVSPDDKAKVVAKLQRRGNYEANPDDLEKPESQGLGEALPVVMFVGDGVNDSPALAQAQVGVAIGSGTDIAVETASVVLMRPELTDVVTAIDLSRKTLQRIHWNFRWAMVYNILAIPAAAGVFFPLTHTTVPPVLAAFAMGFSSVSVVLSSLWLKRYHRPQLSGFFSSGIDVRKHKSKEPSLRTQLANRIKGRRKESDSDKDAVPLLGKHASSPDSDAIDL